MFPDGSPVAGANNGHSAFSQTDKKDSTDSGANLHAQTEGKTYSKIKSLDKMTE